MTTVPSVLRAVAPDPDANHNGMQPRMKANDVIRIGRNRMAAPVCAASMSDLPFSNSVFANATIKIAFFAASPMSMIKPICANTLFCNDRTFSARNAPKIAVGVPSNTLKGSDQLSYCAARIKNTQNSDSPNIVTGLTPCAACFS